MNSSSRIRYSKAFKRAALVEISAGESPYNVFETFGANVKKLCANDKKYLSKLLYKWNKEVYKSNEKMYLLNYELTDDAILREINYLTYIDETDYIISDVRKRALKYSSKYFDLKNKIKTSNALKKHGK